MNGGTSIPLAGRPRAARAPIDFDQSNEPHGTSGMGAPHGPSTRKEG